MENYLDRLNEKQREAVMTTEGPLLVLAGAGSGKTTVLAARIAYIMQNTFTRAWNILAITFTNKAAQEMRQRIGKIIGNDINDMWVGTFHSICLRILRKNIELAGYGTDFVIYDTADSKTVIKECLKELNISDKECPISYTLRVISNAKNCLMPPDELRSEARGNKSVELIADIYALYIKKLRDSNALDFDDLIMITVQILRDYEEVADRYRAQFRYILVDEYQDTNNLQYLLISILAQGRGNVCVVGDDDQSIYKFRGANVDNILTFEDEYKNAKRITLDQNYRSTSVILNAANGVIANNSKRLGKRLWTSKGEGEKISLFVGFNEREEADYVAARIKDIYKETNKYNQCAVLYRTNAQSRAIEESLIRENIPYKVLAGQRFYDRKEIKDIIAYMRLIYNYNDDLSFYRIINEPKRKIGAATLDKIRQHATDEGVSSFEIIDRVDHYSDLKAAAPRLTAFSDMIKQLRHLATEQSVDELVKSVIEMSGYGQMLINDNTYESQTRIENLEEFINLVGEYAKEGDNTGGLGEFLESITLRSDADEYDEADDYVVMMTIHSAKGLEFPTVFLVGMEDGLFPSKRIDTMEDDTEEERRLCYVAITRAKDKLYLSRAMSRFRYGVRMPCDESIFLREIPEEYIVATGGAVSRVTQQANKQGIKIHLRFMEKPQKEKRAALEKYDFSVGERVRHKKFGEGTVLESKSFGNDAVVKIKFDTVGTKQLMAAFAKLERV